MDYASGKNQRGKAAENNMRIDEEVLLSEKLCSSVSNKDFGLCQVLLHLHANPDRVTEEGHGMSASHLAVGMEPVGDAIDFLRLLLQYGANPNARAVCDGITPVLLSAMLGKSKALKMLLASGGDPCIMDSHGNSAFDYGWAHEKVRRVLLKHVEENRNMSSSSSSDESDENEPNLKSAATSKARNSKEKLYALFHQRKPLGLLPNPVNLVNAKTGEKCDECDQYRAKKLCQKALTKSTGVCFPSTNCHSRDQKNDVTTKLMAQDIVKCHCSERHNFSYPMSHKLRSWYRSRKGSLIGNITKALTPSPKNPKLLPRDDEETEKRASLACNTLSKAMIDEFKPELVPMASGAASAACITVQKITSASNGVLPASIKLERFDDLTAVVRGSDSESGGNQSSSSSKLSIESAEKLLNMRLLESDVDKIDISNGEVVGLKRSALMDVSSPNNPFLAIKKSSFEQNRSAAMCSRVLDESHNHGNDNVTMNHFEDDANEEHSPCSPCVPKNRVRRCRTVPSRNRLLFRRQDEVTASRSDIVGNSNTSNSPSSRSRALFESAPTGEQDRRTSYSPFPRYSSESRAKDFGHERDSSYLRSKGTPKRDSSVSERNQGCSYPYEERTSKVQRKLQLVDASLCHNCSAQKKAAENNGPDSCSAENQDRLASLKPCQNDTRITKKRDRKVTFSNSSSSNPSAEVSPFEGFNQEQQRTEFYHSFFNNSRKSDSGESELYRDGEFVFEQLRIPPKSDESLLTSDRSCLESSYVTCADWKSYRSQSAQKNSVENSLETKAGSSVFDSSRNESKGSASRNIDQPCSVSLKVHTSAAEFDRSQDLERLSNEEIYAKLKSRNVLKNGPVTDSTRSVYLRILAALDGQFDGSISNEISNESQRQIVLAKQSEFNYSPNDFPKLLSDYLLSGSSVTSLPDLEGEEQLMVSLFSDPSRSWREGNRKRSFNYLLLDPRVTKNILNRPRDCNEIEIFRYFVSAIFYVGKGQNSRPFSHFTEASRHLKNSEIVSSEKINHIQDIWNSGLGVVNLQLFQNAIAAEAYTREALLIAALGLNRLTNQKKGDFYGVCCSWPESRREQLGIFLLKKAMKIFLQEGEKQIRLKDF